MAGNAAVRRQALRKMYEQWGVPETLLSEASTLKLNSLRALIAKEAWQGGYSVESLQVKLAKDFGRQVDKLTAAMGEDATAETVTRTFAAIAKILETLATASHKIAATTKLGEQIMQEAVGEPKNENSVSPTRADLKNRFSELVKSVPFQG